MGVQKQNANEIKSLLLNHINSYNDNTEYQDWVNVWGKSYKGGEGGLHDIKSINYGILAGFDSFKDEDTLFGLSAGYEHTNAKVLALNSKSKINTFYLLAYGSKKFDSFTLEGGIAGGLSKIEANRLVKEFNDTLSAEYDSYTVQLFTQISKEFKISEDLKLSPYAGVSYFILNTEEFEEKGNVSALRVKGDSEEAGYLSFGLKSLYALKGGISFIGSFGLEQAFGDIKGDSKQSFASGSDTFIVYGAPIAKTSVKLGFGFDFKLLSDFVLTASYEGAYAKKIKEHGTHLGLNYKF